MQRRKQLIAAMIISFRSEAAFVKRQTFEKTTFQKRRFDLCDAIQKRDYTLLCRWCYLKAKQCICCPVQQCEQMASFLLNIWPFATIKSCPIAKKSLAKYVQYFGK